MIEWKIFYLEIEWSFEYQYSTLFYDHSKSSSTQFNLKIVEISSNEQRINEWNFLLIISFSIQILLACNEIFNSKIRQNVCKFDVNLKLTKNFRFMLLQSNSSLCRMNFNLVWSTDRVLNRILCLNSTLEHL